MQKLLFTLLFLSTALAVSAQQNCPFDPTVEGNELVCPNDSLTLTTQQYDAYQWYTRPYGNTSLQPVPGATGPTFTVNSYDLPMYVAVEATLGGCTERGAEVLVDGWAFLPVTVISEGDFEIGPNGELLICPGDTALLTLNSPYGTNIQWYDAGDSIPGATLPKLQVTAPGQFTVSGAPEVCPNFISYLGVTIEVAWATGPHCQPSSTGNVIPVLPAQIVPNPAHTEFRITVDDTDPVELVLLDARGTTVLTQTFTGSVRIDVADLPRGAYVAWLSAAKGTFVQKVLVSEN